MSGHASQTPRRTAPRPWRAGTDEPGPNGRILSSDVLYDATGRPIALFLDDDAIDTVRRAVRAYDGVVELLQAMVDQAQIAIIFGGRLHLRPDLEELAIKLLSDTLASEGERTK